VGTAGGHVKILAESLPNPPVPVGDAINRGTSLSPELKPRTLFGLARLESKRALENLLKGLSRALGVPSEHVLEFRNAGSGVSFKPTSVKVDH